MNSRNALKLMALLAVVNLVMIHTGAPKWMFGISIGIHALFVYIGIRGIINECIRVRNRHTHKD